MAREKATFTLDREKVQRAMKMRGGRSMSDVIDIALDHLIRTEQLRHDVAAHVGRPLTADELMVGDLPVHLDPADDDVDYDALYGHSESARLLHPVICAPITSTVRDAVSPRQASPR